MSYPSIFHAKMQVFFVFKKQFFNVIVMMKKKQYFQKYTHKKQIYHICD